MIPEEVHLNNIRKHALCAEFSALFHAPLSLYWEGNLLGFDILGFEAKHGEAWRVNEAQRALIGKLLGAVALSDEDKTRAGCFVRADYVTRYTGTP